ncbi:MAG: CDP-glycerol glycerophosphotransferase family protein, partial [Clostridia bacterium]|nr:CDP-glycerol glycerophosphotransferase family protein [Clostridia bacterium]
MPGQIFGLLKSKLQRTKKNTWVFTSFEGQYSDNPKYISMKLHELDPSIEIVWLVKKEKLSSLPEYVKGVEIHTEEARKIKASASVIIDNVYGGKSYIVSSGSAVSKIKGHVYKFLVDKKGQHVYTTWHG